MIYLLLFLEFFKVGLFCFGGAFGMIPLIEEVVLQHGWLPEDDFYNLIGVCESTPGPIAVNMATYIGSTQGGILGSLAATLGVVLPSFLIILLIASLLKNMTKHPIFKSFMRGVKPVVIGLILSTGCLLLLKALGLAGNGGCAPNPAAIAIFAILAAVYFLYPKVFGKKLNSIALILLSAALGIGICTLLEGMVG